MSACPSLPHRGSARDRGASGVASRGGIPTGRIPSFAVLVGFLLAGCTESGDFGRPKRSFWNETVVWRGGALAGAAAATAREEPVSGFMFTDDENELRQRAWHFLMPAHERQVFMATLAELVRSRILPLDQRARDIDSYHAAVRGEAEISPAPLYGRIAQDAAADRLLIEPFAALAHRVLAADRTRLKLGLYVTSLGEAEVRDAAARVAENRCLIAWVNSESRRRVASYRFALERLALEAPQRQAVTAEREVVALERDRVVLDRLGVPPLETAPCGSGAVAAEPQPSPAPYMPRTEKRLITK